MHEADELSRERDSLASRLASVESDKEALRQELDAATRQLKRATADREQLESLEKQVDELRAHNDALGAERQQLADELSAASELVRERATELTALAAQYEREKSESASHLNQIEIIFNESLAEAQQKLAASSDELHALRHERNELKAALATAKQAELAADVAGQLERSQQLNEDYELRLKHKQAELHKLQAELGQQVEQLTRDLDMLRAQADALGQDNNELREHLDKERTLRAESNANTERIAHQLGSYQIYFTSIELLKIDF